MRFLFNFTYFIYENNTLNFKTRTTINNKIKKTKIIKKYKNIFLLHTTLFVLNDLFL